MVMDVADRALGARRGELLLLLLRSMDYWRSGQARSDPEFWRCCSRDGFGLTVMLSRRGLEEWKRPTLHSYKHSRIVIVPSTSTSLLQVTCRLPCTRAMAVQYYCCCWVCVHTTICCGSLSISCRQPRECGTKSEMVSERHPWLDLGLGLTHAHTSSHPQSHRRLPESTLLRPRCFGTGLGYRRRNACRNLLLAVHATVPSGLTIRRRLMLL